MCVLYLQYTKCISSLSIVVFMSFMPFLCCVFIYICTGSSLLCRLFSSCCEWALLFVLVQKLLFGEDSPVAEHGLQGRQASEAEVQGSAVAVPGLQGTGSAVVATRLICFASCGIFPDQGSNPCLLHWQADSLPLSQQGSLPFSLFS